MLLVRATAVALHAATVLSGIQPPPPPPWDDAADRAFFPGPGCGGDPEVAMVPHGPSAPLLPPWPPTYNMSLSTAIMPCNYSGMFDSSFSSQFGIVDYGAPPLPLALLQPLSYARSSI